METNSRQADTAAKMAQLLQENNLPAVLRGGIELAVKGLAGDEEAMNAAFLALADITEEDVTGVAPTGQWELSFGKKSSDPVELARQALLKAVYGDWDALQELGRRRLDAIERDLAGPNASPTEQVLVQQAAICWMQLYHYEQKYAARLNVEPYNTFDMQKEEFYHKRVARAQRRLESALKSLAQVRRLQLPTVQVNIADKQVNLGNGQVSMGEAQVNILADTAVGVESNEG